MVNDLVQEKAPAGALELFKRLINRELNDEQAF